MSSENVLGYPNLAQIGLAPDQFDDTWPRCVPCRLFVYFDQFGISVSQCHVDQVQQDAWYPVALGWFDFGCDYFSLIPQHTRSKIAQGLIRVLFYYHEGDNPAHIKDRLDTLAQQHGFSDRCYCFVSANSAAHNIENFFYFPDHEFFFAYVNRRQPSPSVDAGPRSHDFTVLNRTHKWWRASVMTDMLNAGLLRNSLWSYNTEIDIQDDEKDNPIELDLVRGWRQNVYHFVQHGPYVCDSSDDVSHNDHRLVSMSLWQQSYFNLVLETHFDADGSGGTFITEKTYKCIKFGQPFVIIGPPNTLAVLRQHGYRVFDHVIDNTYDTINNNTQRWFRVKQAIQDLQCRGLARSFQDCLEDVIHNQAHFTAGNATQLQRLVEFLTADTHAV